MGFVWVTLDSSIQGFVISFQICLLGQAGLLEVRGLLDSSLRPQHQYRGLVQRECPVSGQRTHFIAGLPLTPFKASFDSPSVTVSKSQAHGQAVLWRDRDKPDSVLILKVLPVWPGRAKWTAC